MNPIVEIFTNISNEELHQAIKDINSANKTGIYESDSVVRKYAQKVRDITGQITSLDLLGAEISLLREAANRWDSKYSQLKQNKMGLDTTHNCWHGAYSSFHRFRKSLAEQIGINLEEFEGYEGDKRFEDVKHDIVPLLDHSDCDGELSVEESKQIVKGLNDILENFKEDIPHDSYFKDKIIQFRDGCIEAIEKDERVKFQ